MSQTIKIQLPVREIPFSTYHNQIAGGLALSVLPDFMNYYINHCVTISCEKNFLHGYSSPEVNIPKAHVFDINTLDCYKTSMRFLPNSLHQMISDMLEENFYIYCNGIDDFYIPGKSWYNERHYHHDCIILGIDDSANTYTISAYDNQWVLKVLTIPQKCLTAGMRSSLNAGVIGEFAGVKARPSAIPLDLSRLYQGLSQYISSDLSIYPLDSSQPAQGIVIHDYLTIYLGMIENGDIHHGKVDWRIMRLFWEHKKCMANRIFAIENALSLSHKISDCYSQVVNRADKMRMMFAIYIRKRRDSMIPYLIQELTDIKGMESGSLKDLLNIMEEKKCHSGIY